MKTMPQQEKVDATFSPAVLIVDDDLSVRQYYREKFHEETSIGVITAKDLLEAKSLLESDTIKIDAVMADIFFDHGTTAPQLGLFDGLDILALAQNRDSSISQYVLSYWSSRQERREKAAKYNLNITKWFDKEFISAKGDTKAPWAAVERDLVVRRMRADSSLASRIRALSDDPSKELDEDLAAEAFRSLHPPVRTYIQTIEEFGERLAQPIEVICFRDNSGVVSANAWRLGLFTEGSGASVLDALDDLSSKIVDEYEIMMEQPASALEGYSRLVRDRLEKYFTKVDTTHD